MKNKQKLLYIVEAMGGGVFTYLVELANELINTYDVYIAYAVRPQTPYDYVSYFDNRIHLIKVENFTRSLDFVKDIKAFFEIRKIAKKIQPDIIHMHSSKAGALGRLAFNGHKVKLFYTPHGYSFLMANHSNMNRILYKFIETVLAKRCCTTIACSEGEFRESLKFSKKNSTYVDNGINTKQLQATINSVGDIQEHPFTVFTLGRICYQKNPELFNKIAKAMPNVHFLWIGDGNLRNQLTADNIEITGWVDREAAIKYSLSADVFLLTSLWEGLPMSLLEAMYMKKLCVVSNVVGNRDVIQTGDNGFVCNTIEEFISAIQVAKDGDTKIILEHAYENIKSHYNTTVMADKYSNIYQEVIGKI